MTTIVDLYARFGSIVPLDRYNELVNDVRKRLRLLELSMDSTIIISVCLAIVAFIFATIVLDLKLPTVVYTVLTLGTLLTLIVTLVISVVADGLAHRLCTKYGDILLPFAFVGYALQEHKANIVYDRDGYKLIGHVDYLQEMLIRIAKGEITHIDYLLFLLKYARYDNGRLVRLDIEKLEKNLGNHNVSNREMIETVLQKLRKLREIVHSC